MIKKIKFVWLAICLIVFVLSCAQEQTPRSYVQVNVVDKSLFEGEWWMTSVVIENNYPSSESGAQTFPGDSGGDYASGGFQAARIRWVIDENYLYGFRSYELIDGANPDGEGNIDSDNDGDTDGYRGEPIIAFKIESHFDIQRSYNPTTGEEYNVIEENSIDKKWYERQYMRVEWQTNLVTNYQLHSLALYSLVGLYKREPGEFFIHPGSDFPESWQPQFVFTPDAPVETTDPNSFEAYMQRYYDEFGPNQLYYMSFVTRELFTPETVADPYTGEPVPWCMSVYSDAPTCVTNSVTIRHSFLKVSPEHQYLGQNQPDNEFDRFGLFRNEQRTYDDSNPDDPSDPSYGETDYKNYTATLHRIWQNYKDENGNSIPVSQRDPLAMHIWLTSDFPTHLIRTAMNSAAEWGSIYMNLVRINHGEQIPDQYYTDSTCNTNEECTEQYGSDDPRTTCDQDVGQCRRHYNPFKRPDTAHNDYDCWVGALDEDDNPIEVNDTLGQNPDDPNNPLSPATEQSDFDSDRQLQFFGSECMLVLHVNPCDVDTTQSCIERGDLRYPFFSWIDMPDCPFLGVATVRGDPVTGEFIAGDANVGGWDLHWYRTHAMQMYDLLTGNISEEEFVTGEDVRGYLEAFNYIETPSMPVRGSLQAENNIELPASLPTADLIRKNFENVMTRAERLKGDRGRTAIYSDRIRKLAGTPTEYRLFNNLETAAVAGIRSIPSNNFDNMSFSEDFLDRVSPFRNSLADIAAANELWDERMGRFNWLQAENIFTSYSILKYVEDHIGYQRSQLVFSIERSMYEETVLHEFGHILGLRHNFQGTTDASNFHPEYFEIVDRYPMPSCTPTDLTNGTCEGPDPNCTQWEGCDNINFDANDDGQLDRDETRMLVASQDFVRKYRELAGMEYYWTSSLMDYTPEWYHRLVGLASYDKAAIYFNYGRIIEVYDNENNSNISQLNNGSGRRTYFRYYAGGETCQTDSDCPYNINGNMSDDLLQVQKDAGITQRCIPNSRITGGSNVCSDTYADVKAYNDAGNDRYIAVEYKFCTDDRVADTSDCARMDEGASYQEIVRNLRETYHRKYIWNNFRRYRHTFGFSDYLYRVDERIFQTIARIYQHMFYRWANEGEEYRNNAGAFGFYDQYLASVDALNFFAEILTTPDVGGYSLQEYQDHSRYERWTDDPYFGGGLTPITLGYGKYMYSDYQQGLTGIYRLDRIGVIYDKMFALEYLSSRNNGYPYTIDEPYYVNFYDAFPNEIGELFGSLIAAQPWRYAPRIEMDDNGTPHMYYLDWWYGDCDYDDNKTCRTNPSDEFGDMLYVDDGNLFYIQNLAAIYSLSEFPVYWDTSWEQRMHIFVEGTPQGQDICDCNDPCAAQEECLEQGVGYVKYTSPRWNQTYVAVQVQPDSEGRRGNSYAFEAVKRAVEIDEVLSNSPLMSQSERSALETEQEDLETFFRFLIQLQSEYGINNWMY